MRVLKWEEYHSVYEIWLQVVHFTLPNVFQHITKKNVQQLTLQADIGFVL